MDIAGVKQVLPALLKHKIVPFLWGYQGVGKTQVVRQVAQEQDLRVFSLNLAAQEPGDLIGLLSHNADGTVSHSRPSWFPTSGQGIIFLDEYNRAPPEVIQVMFPFLLEGRLHEHRLPEGWAIVAAGNYPTEEFTTTDVQDKAMMNRFCHIHFEPSVEEFAAFAESKGQSLIAAFALETPECIEERRKTRYELPLTPCRRSLLDFIGPLEAERFSDDRAVDDQRRLEVYSGIIGLVAASRFMGYRSSSERRIRIGEILTNYASVRDRLFSTEDAKQMRFDRLAAPVQELCAMLSSNKDYLATEVRTDNFIKFLLDAPKEVVVKALTDLRAKLPFKHSDLLFNSQALCARIVK